MLIWMINNKISQAKTASKATPALLLSKGEEALIVQENGRPKLTDSLD